MRRGFILVTPAVYLIGLLAIMGLATDVARLYVSYCELQALLNEAALTASYELDDTSAGLGRAQTVATAALGSTSHRWNFDSRSVLGIVVQFSSAPEGPFHAAPAPAGQRFVKVQTAKAVDLHFLPLIPGLRSWRTIRASAVGGGRQSPSVDNGLSTFPSDDSDFLQSAAL